jgi:hypothetical protein
MVRGLSWALCCQAPSFIVPKVPDEYLALERRDNSREPESR